jgi:GT2 family glycosyltransferase
LHIAIVIVAFRNLADIERCLAALSRASYRDFEVVICENGGEEAYRLLEQRVPDQLPGNRRVQVFDAGGNLGYAGGVNFCIDRSPDADAWLVLNPDTEPDPLAVEHLAGKLGDGSCDAASGILHYEDGTVQSYGGRWLPWLARAEAIGQGKNLTDGVDPLKVEELQSYLNGACMLVGRRFVQTAGHMREDYFLYCEEVEWCLRAMRAGLRLGFVPEAKILHRQGTTTGAGGSIRTRGKLPIYLDERNKMLLTRDLFPARLPAAAIAAAALILMRFARRRAWRQVAYAFQGWAAGLLNRRGPPSWIGS